MTLGELFEETYIQGKIAIRSYDADGREFTHYKGDAMEFYPEENREIINRAVSYIYIYMEENPSSCSSWKMRRKRDERGE